MYEINKEQFGIFVAGLRKEQGLTQKDLAEQLFVSNKAVSKWETGVSIPDISLLIPLAEALGVSVTELLQCRRLPAEEPMDTTQVEELVKTTIGLSGDDPKSRFRKGGLKAYLLCLGIGLLELAALWLLKLPMGEALATMMILSSVFGLYFFCFAPERLPDYYDQNHLHYYNDGFFKMNIPGVRFSNRNWRYILRCGQIWCMVILLGYAPLSCVLSLLPLGSWAEYIPLFLSLGGLFGPMIYVGRKYQ